MKESANQSASAGNTPVGPLGRDTAGGADMADSVSQPGGKGKPVPKSFGRYRIERCLGEGAMGAVYLAHDMQLERRVALKIPKLNEETDATLLERFYREAKSVATLAHANICPIFDVGEIDGRSFISMAFVDGHPLSEIAGKGKYRQPMRVAALVRKIALAMAHAHERGIVHRDLKPANIMIDESGEPVIMDFGLAHRTNLTEDIRLTQSGSIIGSPAYMSPEQVNGEIHLIGPRSDIYSLGITLYELLTGETPFRGSMASVMAQILTGEARSPSQVRADLDPGLETICLKMMARDVEGRFQTMKAVADALKSFLKEKQSSATILSTASELQSDYVPVTRKRRAKTRVANRRRNKRTKTGLWVGAVAFVSGIAIAIAVTTMLNRADDEPFALSSDGKPIAQSEDIDRQVVTNVIGMKLALIPPGRFLMGSSATLLEADSDEQPQHRVTISEPFYIGVYEVTQHEFAEVMGSNPSVIAASDSSTHPVNNVNWRDSEEFCRQLTLLDGHIYRLPTEAEWEYACRAGRGQKWSCGDDQSELRRHGWYFETAEGKGHSVGLLKPNAFGLFDMHGNVAEWCQDWYDSEYYEESGNVDPPGPVSSDSDFRPTTRVVRGGNWDNTATRCRSAFRGSNSPTVKSSRTGFRVVRLADDSNAE